MNCKEIKFATSKWWRICHIFLGCNSLFYMYAFGQNIGFWMIPIFAAIALIYLFTICYYIRYPVFIIDAHDLIVRDIRYSLKARKLPLATMIFIDDNWLKGSRFLSNSEQIVLPSGMLSRSEKKRFFEVLESRISVPDSKPSG